MPYLTEHQHGKSKVRLGRTWRCASTGQHDFVEWEIEVQLLSRAMNAAYTNGTNDGMTTTDTTKNMVRTYLCHTCARVCVRERLRERCLLLLLSCSHFFPFAFDPVRSNRAVNKRRRTDSWPQ
jgi:hypothetical protein